MLATVQIILSLIWPVIRVILAALAIYSLILFNKALQIYIKNGH